MSTNRSSLIGSFEPDGARRVALIPNDLEADPSRDLGGHVAMGSKAFFSEEKKQKTFANSGTCTTRTVRDSN
jgi:hypothetical protein